MALSQTDRLIRIATPLGDKAFVVLSFSGTEEISKLFAFKLQLASERNDINFDQLAGKNVTVGIGSTDGTERCFNGMIIGFEPSETSTREGYSKYSAVMSPSAWALTQCVDCRIFQDKNIPDILKEVLSQGSLGVKGVGQKIDFLMDLSGSYAPKEFCVQYNETDMEFIDRLCETEGIFYFFKHENGKHTMVFADKADKHKPYLTGPKETVTFQSPLGGVVDKEVISSLQPENRLMTGKYTARDYNFTTPANDLTVQQATQNAKPKSEGEIYEYPGGYEETGHGQTLAKVRIEARDACMHTMKGRSNCRGFTAGFKFKLKEYPVGEMNGKDYVFIHVHHEARQHFTSGAPDGDVYFNQFVCLPHKIPFRSRRRTIKPLIASSQTAIVTGPKAEEIHTDEHGRVKVKFHWDRRGNKSDGNMSCWIRVSQAWAGAQWGAIYTPRVGHEVIVNFLEGDPDRPIITGRVYHGQNKPPYNLPAEKTKSTLKSNSTKNGGGAYNEIRFEDLKGEEEFYTHASKDQNEVIENDMSTDIKRNQMIQVKKNRKITVLEGDESITIARGTRDVTVESNETHVNQSSFDHSVKGNYTLKVNGNILIDATGLVVIKGLKVLVN